MDTSSQSEWWQTCFDPDWIKIFAYKNQDTRREVQSIIKLLGLSPGAKILDLGCGNGRISIALAKLGYRITGLDYSSALLEDAAVKARRLKLNIEWVQGDMRDFSLPVQFDAVINIFSSFGYFLDDSDNLKMLRFINRSLKSSGKLILDLENIYLISRIARIYGGEALYRPLEKYRGWVEEITDFNPVDQRVYMHLRLMLPGYEKPRSARVSYRVYNLMELKSLLEQAELSFCNVYGDFGLHPYTLDSDRMILLCTKKSPGHQAQEDKR